MERKVNSKKKPNEYQKKIKKKIILCGNNYKFQCIYCITVSYKLKERYILFRFCYYDYGPRLYII